MRHIKTIFSYLTDNTEFIAVVFLLIGIISFNKDFAYVGVANIYIVEFVLIIVMLSIVLKYIINNVVLARLNTVNFLSFVRTFWPLVVILIFALVNIFLDRSYGFQTLRHSLIFLYTVAFIFVFSLSVKNKKQLDFILVYLIIVFSALFNGVKIIVYRSLNYTFHYEEQERVLHNEADIICASLSLLGVLVYHKFFWKKSKLLTIIIVILNLVIIILAVKRSALAGIIPAVIVYFIISGQEINYKRFIKIVGVFLLVAIAGYFVWFFVSENSLLQFQHYFVNKFSLAEKNTNWRLQAWGLAFNKFLESPLWGIGYGEKILTYPLQGTDTHDPHNSILAFLVRHGIVVFLIFIFFIIRTYTLLYSEIKNSAKGEPTFYTALFLCMGLTAMIFFAFFNVVLENQYEGIFFHLFLSGVYVMNAQKLSSLHFQNQTRRHYIVNVGMVISIVVFFLFAFSPYNEVKRINLYSAKTNSSLPIPFEGDFQRISIKSLKDEGITVKNKEYNKYVNPGLSWFFPSRAAELKLADYEMVVEYEKFIKEIKYYLEYEDASFIQLNSIREGNLERLSFKGIKTREKQLKIKILTIKFPFFDSLVVKNIYINKVK